MNSQDLMFFEAEAVATEAAKCDAQSAVEQHEREAKAAAKVLLQAARDKIKAEKQAKTEDWRRRTSQARTCRPPTNTPCAASAGIAGAKKTATAAATGTTAMPAASP